MLLTRTRITTLLIAVVLFTALSSLTSECQAQRRRFVFGQEIHRFLGAYHGAGYHCQTPGQNTDYYNPYSAHNSALLSANEPFRENLHRYPNFDTDTVPHSVYTSRDQDQHSVFEALPGQTVTPKFEPAVDRTQKKKDAEFRDNLNFDSDSDSDFDTGSDFDPDRESGSDTKSDLDLLSTLEEKADDVEAALATENDGGFDALKENFDALRENAKSLTEPDSFGDDSFLE